MQKRTVITLLLTLLSLSGMAQADEPSTQREKQNWAWGGVLVLLAPGPDYYDKNLERYNPVVPMVWFGSSWMDGGMMGDPQAQLPLRSGVFTKTVGGFTLLQVSRNLYRGNFGLSAGIQFGGYSYDLSSGYSAEKEGYRVEIVPSDEDHKKDQLSFTALRIPLMIGAQTNNRLFSLQTGLGLYHTSRFGAQWLVTAGIGPFTVNYSHNLTPLFKLNDGTKAYPSSLSVGVDIWYWLCRFSHPKE